MISFEECNHENIRWGDDNERGECLDCGATCDWHWGKEVFDNSPDYVAEADVREIIQWHRA